MSDRRKVLELFEQQKEFVDKKVSEGIETYRKGNANVTVTDQNGNPIPNARVTAVQTSHEFRFGANLFMLDELETAEKNAAYKQRFADLFNMATLPFYWDATEPEQGKTRYDKNSEKFYRRPPIDLCIEFCERHGIEPREHALAYDAFFPKWLYNASVDEVKAALEKRFSEIAERYADKIRTIEVTNEMVFDPGHTAFYRQPDYVEWCFKTAEKYFPHNQLGINEYTFLGWEADPLFTNQYYAYTEAAMLKGARIDAIGMQYHLFNNREEEYEKTRKLLNPKWLYRHMDLFAHLGKPLQVTEVTVPSYSWEEDDEQIQAELIENLYSLWFSHPNVEQIIYWNLIDGYAYVWNPDPEKIKSSQGNMTVGENYYHGGLLRFDASPKPAYFKLKELIEKTWHTEIHTTTDENGKLSFRGFYGDYRLEITVDGKTTTQTVSLSSKNDNQLKVVI